MPSSQANTTEQGRERCQAAAWAWYERGAVSGTLICRQGSTALMVRGKYMRSRAAGSSTHEKSENGSVQLMVKASKKCLPPSRFKREAEALVQERRHVQVYADQEVVCSSELSHCKTSTSSLPPPSAHCPMDDPCPSDALSAPPQEDRCWSDKLLGISSRKSTSSLEYIDQELDSLILFLERGATAGLSSQRSSLFDSFELQELLRKLGSNEGDKSDAKSAEAVEAFVPDQPAKGAMENDPKEALDLINVAEAQESHDGEQPQEINLGPEAAKYSPAESVSEPENTSSGAASGELYVSTGCLNPAITFSSESTRSSPTQNILSASPPSESDANYCKPMVGTPVFHLNTPPTPPYSKQTLHDLLQWSPRSPACTTPDCHCASADLSDSEHFYYSESPDLNSITAGSCNSSRCKNVKASHRRRRRRPSLLMPTFSHSFSSALHHIPHLPHSFSHALHHLPHSLSNALHHLPHLPSSLSNAFHQIAHLTHSLSSAYKNHVASHHKGDVEASPSHDAKINAHSHHKPFHLRHFFSFKVHHSPSHPEIAVGGTSPSIADYRSSPSAAATLVHHHPTSPSRERRLSASNDYMLIYSSTKKKFSKGSVHHHHHHHHHHHYIL